MALAVKEHIRRAKLKKLADFLGTVAIDEQTIQEGNQAEMNCAKWLEEIGERNNR